MIKKIAPYILLLILSALIAWIVIPGINKSPDVNSGFSVDKDVEISRIILDRMDGESVELEKQNGVWYVNGKYKVRKRQLNTLLKTLYKMQKVHPVSDAAMPNVMKEIMSSGVKSKVYNSKGKLVKSFYVGRASVGSSGSYMLLEPGTGNEERPYVVNIPGFKGFLGSRFMTDVEEWRSREVLSYDPQEIVSVSLSYPHDESASFTIRRADGILKLYPETEGEPSARLLNAYYDLFRSRSVETYINNYSKRDSIIQTQPFAVLAIESKNGQTEVIPFFYKEKTERTKMQAGGAGEEQQFDIDRYYALVNKQQDFAIIQYYVFGGIFRKYEDFFEMENIPS